MAAAPEILAEGQLANTKGTLFTATGQTIIRLIAVSHVAGGTQSVVLYVKKGASTSRVIARATLLTDEFGEEDQIITLDTGDLIEGETTDAASVDYLIMGVKIA